MNANNIILSTLGSGFLAISATLLHANLWEALAAAVVGIICWVAYDYLP